MLEQSSTAKTRELVLVLFRLLLVVVECLSPSLAFLSNLALCLDGPMSINKNVSFF